jgi:hypothetical protein
MPRAPCRAEVFVGWYRISLQYASEHHELRGERMIVMTQPSLYLS